MIWGMQWIMAIRNWAMSSTSTMFRTEILIPYLALRILTMHLHPPYDHSHLHGQGGKRSREWQAKLTLETRLKVHQQRSGQIFDTLPCSESFINAFPPATQISEFQDPRRATTFGMAALINSRNSAVNST